MEFAALVETSAAVAATSSKRAKASVLAEFLNQLDLDEIEPAIGFLLATPRQGRLGVGWAQVFADRPSIAEDRNPTDESAVRRSLSIGDVDVSLSRLAGISGTGSQQRRRVELDALFASLTSLEAAFMRGLFLGEIRQGALAGILADAVALSSGAPVADVRRAAMLSGSLATAALVVRRQGPAGLKTVGLEVGRAVQPMLASTAVSVAAAVEQVGEASIEWKLDGARIQLHRQGDEVRIFTRNLNEITARLPQVVEIARSMPVESCVLDGEVLGLDPDGRPQIFQDTMSRFGSDEHGAASELRPYFFDIIHLDGRDLLDEPLTDRQHQLAVVAGPWRLPTLVSADPAAAEAFGAEALAAGHEGVMVKAVGSAYEAGRRGALWLKVKPVRTLDLVVIAAEWGHGRRRGWLSNLHLAARGGDGEFVMVGKTFKGMTDELLRWQTEALQQLATSTGEWVVPVRPELVVEIALDGVQISRRYPGGVALRFARVRGYRPDRDAASADTIETVRAMLGGGAPSP